MASSSASVERATHRTVVLLRKSEKAKLERLASRQKISSAEVIRRFIRDGESLLGNKQEQEMIEAALKLISTAAREANESMVRTMDKVDRLHEEIMLRDIR
jgi:outer membrane lipopolysaccharide assembly protein LptE/RlpB